MYIHGVSLVNELLQGISVLFDAREFICTVAVPTESGTLYMGLKTQIPDFDFKATWSRLTVHE
jgi:hypothetical protein